MIEQQVDEKFVAAADESILATNEREAGTQLEQKTRDVTGERRFDMALLSVFRQPQEIEYVRILQCFARQIGLRWWQSRIEIGDRGTVRVITRVPNLSVGERHGGISCRSRAAAP